MHVYYTLYIAYLLSVSLRLHNRLPVSSKDENECKHHQLDIEVNTVACLLYDPIH